MWRKDFLLHGTFYILTFVFDWLYFTQCLTSFFFLSITFLAFMHGFWFYFINIDEGLSINPSANVFVFGDFNFYHKDWLTYSGGTDRPGELCNNFSISYDLTQTVNFPTRIPDCNSQNPDLLNFFFLTLVFVLQRLSLHWEILIMFLSQFPMNFRQTQNGLYRFIA